MDCFVAGAPSRRRFAFVAGNDGNGETDNDRLPDIAGIGRSHRHRRLGVRIVSAKIIQFVLRARRDRVLTGVSGIVVKFQKRVDDLVMDHADAVPGNDEAPSRQGGPGRDRR
jgi:hypothetical protein